MHSSTLASAYSILPHVPQQLLPHDMQSAVLSHFVFLLFLWLKSLAISVALLRTPLAMVDEHSEIFTRVADTSSSQITSCEPGNASCAPPCKLSDWPAAHWVKATESLGPQISVLRWATGELGYGIFLSGFHQV